jgi:hypothetical protein
MLLPPIGSYRGGGCRVTSDGRTGDYIGFDRQVQLDAISQKNHPQFYFWNNADCVCPGLS